MRVKPCFLGASLLLAPAVAEGQSLSMTVPATAAVTIVAPSSVREAEPMEGDVAPPAASGGEVVVDPARSSPGSAVRPAAYKIAGRRDAAIALALPPGRELTLTSADATIKMQNVKVSVAGGPSTSQPGGLTLNGSGNLNFKVGGTLVMAANQPKRNYVGDFSVTLAYN